MRFFNYSMKFFQAFVTFVINVKCQNVASDMTLGKCQLKESCLLRFNGAEYGWLFATFARHLFSHRRKTFENPNV